MSLRIADVPTAMNTAAANRARVAQAQAAEKPIFITVNEAWLADKPGFRALYVDLQNAIDDFRTAADEAARKAGAVKPGQEVTFFKGPYGWTIKIDEAKARKSRGPDIGDAA